MKKKLLLIIFATFMALHLTACDQKETNVAEVEEIYYADVDFISDLSKGLMARWDASAATENSSSVLYSAEYAGELEIVVDQELNAISKYRTEQFENNKLQEACISYLNLLEDSKEIIPTMITDTYEFVAQWEKSQNERAKIIAEFITSYGLTVDEAHQSTLDQFVTQAKAVVASEEKDLAITEMLTSLEFQETDEGFGSYKTYRAVLVNDSGYNFDSISLTIDLLDENGVILDQAYAYTSTLAAGKSINLEFSSDKNFSSYEVQPAYYLSD